MSEIPKVEIEEVDILPIGLYVIPPPKSLPDTRHITRELDTSKPTFEWQIPSYTPMQWNLKDMQIIEGNAGTPNPPETPNANPDVNPEVAEEIACPGPENLRIGDLRNSKAKEKVIGHELKEGKCIEIYAPTTFADKFLPSPSVAATTFSITVVATAAASLTPIITKALKPIFKQLINRVKKLFGKKVERPSPSQIRANSYREKKGLPPLKEK